MVVAPLLVRQGLLSIVSYRLIHATALRAVLEIVMGFRVVNGLAAYNAGERLEATITMKYNGYVTVLAAGGSYAQYKDCGVSSGHETSPLPG